MYRFSIYACIVLGCLWPGVAQTPDGKDYRKSFIHSDSTRALGIIRCKTKDGRNRQGTGFIAVPQYKDEYRLFETVVTAKHVVYDPDGQARQCSFTFGDHDTPITEELVLEPRVAAFGSELRFSRMATDFAIAKIESRHAGCEGHVCSPESPSAQRGAPRISAYQVFNLPTLDQARRLVEEGQYWDPDIINGGLLIRLQSMQLIGNKKGRLHSASGRADAAGNPAFDFDPNCRPIAMGPVQTNLVYHGCSGTPGSSGGIVTATYEFFTADEQPYKTDRPFTRAWGMNLAFIYVDKDHTIRTREGRKQVPAHFQVVKMMTLLNPIEPILQRVHCDNHKWDAVNEELEAACQEHRG
ncbi:MAG: hypothetical protein ABJI42_17285 [Henriciella sp.]